MHSDTTSAAGVYVGMTRGRKTNRLHIVASDMTDARAQFIEAMERDSADHGLDHAPPRGADTRPLSITSRSRRPDAHRSPAGETQMLRAIVSRST
uniref:hypothetical protein n=1 Tax=Tessaracoccus bendigoensis TaxID=72764 RepID=UPI001C31707B|nr:hypothetical protein [Tessaracoccus bendigoensis]